MELKTFTFGPFQTNTYVVSLSDRLLLIDPACSSVPEQRQLYAFINSRCSVRPFPVTILATHGHLDHLWGAAWATFAFGTPVLMHQADIPMARAMQQQYDLFGIRATPAPFPVEPLPAADLPSLTSACHPSQPSAGQPSTAPASGQPLLPAGLSVLHTPGHTPGSVCFWLPEARLLFSGDTLFCMGYGRTDLPGGSLPELVASLSRLFSLPADILPLDTRVFPGHGSPTTIASERR